MLNKVSVDGFSFDTGPASAKGKANLTLDWKDGELQSVSGDVNAADVRVDLPDWFYQPFAISRLSVSAVYDRPARTITWSHATIDAGGIFGRNQRFYAFGGFGGSRIGAERHA